MPTAMHWAVHLQPLLSILLSIGMLVGRPDWTYCQQSSHSDNSAAANSFPAAQSLYRQQLTDHQLRMRAEFDRLASQLESRSLSAEKPAAPGQEAKKDPDFEAIKIVVAILRQARDVDAARIRILAYRSPLKNHWATQVDAILTQLESVRNERAKIQSAYQPFLAEHIRRQWPTASLSKKRQLAQEFAMIEGKSADALQPRLPIQVHLPLGKFVAQMLAEFDKETQTLLRPLDEEYRTFAQKMSDRIGVQLLDQKISDRQSAALLRLQNDLTADWAREFRSFLFWNLDLGLPDEIREAMLAKRQSYLESLRELVEARSIDLERLRLRWSEIGEEHLKKSEFTEAFVVDWRLHELSSGIAPVWIKAFRNPHVKFAEDALLLTLRNDRYCVRWLLDASESQLPRDQVVLHPADLEPSPLPPVRFQIPEGPGTPLNERTILRSGQAVKYYRYGIWYDARVTDLSPFGVLLQCIGLGEVREPIPRSLLLLPM